jgi:hypothetical protein
MKSKNCENSVSKKTKVGTVKISKQSGVPKKAVKGIADGGIAFKTKKK